MSSTTLQFVVVGALIAAWAWMLGRPVLTNLFRRSRRDSVGHFRYQQAVLGQSLFDDATDEGLAEPLADAGGRPRPIAEWREQPVERRRLQLMLSFAIATFLSLLMAIALRGAFIRLFVLMAVCFATYLGIAAIIGASQLRRQEREYAAQRQAADPEAEFWAQPAVDRVFIDADVDQEFVDGDVDPVSGEYAPAGYDDLAPLAELADEVDDDTSAASILDGLATYDDLASFGQGIFDEDFFEPVPELASQYGENKSDYESVDFDDEPVDFDDEPVDFDDEPIAEADPEDAVLDSDMSFDSDTSFDYVSPFEYTPLSEPHSVLWADLEAEQEPQAEQIDQATPEVDVELPEADAEPVAPEIAASFEEPTFTAAPEQRVRPPKRNKARPIYIESQLDEAEQQKAVND